MFHIHTEREIQMNLTVTETNGKYTTGRISASTQTDKLSHSHHSEITVQQDGTFSLLDSNIITKLENGRDNEDTYATFLQITMKNLTGLKKWSEMVKTITKLMDDVEAIDGDIDTCTNEILELKCWTHSDEAFLITVIANNIDVWVCDLKRQPRGMTTTKFTKVTVALEGNKKKTRKEWSMEGIANYNARIKTIREKFYKDSSFYVKFLKSLRDENPKQKRRKIVHDDQPIVAPTIYENDLNDL